MQQSTNIYQRARESVGYTQEKSAELLGISITCLKDYENDRRLPPDRIVVAMMDIYGFQVLGQQHLRLVSEIGRELIPEVSEKQFAEAVCAFFASIPNLDRMRMRLIEIAADGKINPNERKDFDNIMVSLDKMVKSIYDLRQHKKL